MRIIKELCAQIQEEIEGAKDYAISALDYKISDYELSKLYHSLSEVEYEHAHKLHEVAERKVLELRNTGVKIPEDMEIKYEEKHKRFIACMAEAKVYIDLY